VDHREGLLLGRRDVRERSCTRDQGNEDLQIQSMTRSPAALGDILRYKGYLGDPPLKSLPGRRPKKVMACLTCPLSFTVITQSDGKPACCPRCTGSLEDAGDNRRGRVLHPGRSRDDAPRGPQGGAVVRHLQLFAQRRYPVHARPWSEGR
jgi:hypothetical protein